MWWPLSGPLDRSGPLSSVVPAVVDASALVELLIRGPSADAVQAALAEEEVVAPDLVDGEVLGALVALERRRAITPVRAERALRLLRRAPIRRVPNAALLMDAWALRRNVSAYDAMYVALARRLMCSLVTLDARLARSPRLGVPIMVVTS